MCAQAGPEGTSKLYEEVSQMPMAPTPAAMLSFPSVHLCPSRAYHVVNYQRKRRLGPGLWVVPPDMLVPPERGQLQHDSLLLGHP